MKEEQLPMLWRGRLDHRALTVCLRDQSVTVSLETELVVAADRAGRLFSVFRDGHTFRRGLNGKVLHKWRTAGERHWASLDGPAADDLVDEAAAFFRRVREANEAGDGREAALELVRPPRTPLASTDALAAGAADEDDAQRHRPALAAALEVAAGFDSCAARNDAEQFARLYQPIGILPPDHYLSLVLQATEGCSFNTCTFCDLFHRPYRVKTIDAFAQHVTEVRAWLGASISLRGRSVFLGAANALAVPTHYLLPMLEVVEREIGPPAGVHAFVDGFTGRIKDARDYQALAAAGLRRVYVGLESGHDPLLAFVHKPASRQAAVATVQAIKAAGVQVAVIVMTGLGGHRFASEHERDTAAALTEMALGRGDLIYVSDLVEIPATAYPRIAAEAGIRALSSAERAAQREAILGALSFAGPPPKIARYDVREFVY